MDEKTSKDTPIGFMLTREMKRKLKIQAAAEGRSVTDIMEEIIQKYLETANQEKREYALPED